MNAQNLTTFLIVLLLQIGLSCYQPQCTAAAPDELWQAMAALDAELQGDSARRDRWREALEMERLEKLVRQEFDVDVSELESIQRRYAETEISVGSTLLANARSAVTKWAAAPDDEAFADEATDALARFRRSIIRASSRSRWVAILRINELSREVAKGVGHDKAKVTEIIAGFAAEEAHVDRSRFIAVRRSLGRWINELEEPVSDSLARQARDAVVSYRPVETWRADEARDKLRSRLRDLQAFLATGADRKREGWERYLRLNDLRSAIDQPLDARLSILNRIRQQFESGAIGLQHPEFRRTRAALREYFELSRMAEASNARRTQARERLQNAVNRLGDFVASGGTRKDTGWKRYLRWDALNDELASTEPDIQKLRAIQGQFNSGVAGLEKMPFQLAGRRLDKYVELLLLQQLPQPVDLYASQLERLARALEKHSSEPTGVSASDIARSMKWLDSMGQAPDLMQRIRSRYSHTNLFASLSGRVLNEQVDDVVTDHSRVGQWFKGAYISGTASTKARIRSQLVPNSDRVVLDILMTGTTTTSTVGRKRRVSVKSTGTTWLSGSKRLYFEPDGGLSAQSATASAKTNQKIRGINVDRQIGRQLVTRLAKRQACQSLPEAESLANREARQRIRKQMDDEAESIIAKANAQLRERIEMPLRKERLYPEFIHVSSTSERVEMEARLTPDNHMGAPGEPPDWNQDDDVAICLHESVVNNALAPFLGGLRIDNDNIVELLEDNDLEVPAELQPGGNAADEEWSVTFDLWQPISIAIRQNRINVSILGVRFTRENDVIDQRIRIGASYRVKWKAQQLPEFFREGEVEIEFIDSPGQLSTKQLAYKTLLNRKVGSLFSDHIDASELKPENEQLSEALEAITLRRVSLNQGWLSAGLDVDVEALPLEL